MNSEAMTGFTACYSFIPALLYLPPVGSGYLALGAIHLLGQICSTTVLRCLLLHEIQRCVVLYKAVTQAALCIFAHLYSSSLRALHLYTER